jgi:glyoxylase-like metal-dependent hydrolase (beta-lactamase superfamily II)
MRLFNSAHIDVAAGLVRRGAGFKTVSLTVRYGLIDLRERGLCLVDTGVGPEVTRGERTAALRLYGALLRPKLIASQSPQAILSELGATADDIRHIVLTHFHADHISSLREFTRAEIITCGDAAKRVMAMSSAAALRHGVFKELIPAGFEPRLRPLQAMKQVPTDTVLGDGYDLFGDASYLAVPLPGHAIGHFGMLWRDQAGPVIYATDASWTTQSLLEDQMPWISSAVVFDDRRAGRDTQELLRQFHRQGGRILLCHDVEDEPS